MIDWLKTHWFLLSAVLSCGMAWGQQANQVNQLQDRLNKAEITISQQQRIDERTIIMQKDMEEQRKILIELLMTQRAIAEKNRIVVPQTPTNTDK